MNSDVTELETTETKSEDTKIDNFDIDETKVTEVEKNNSEPVIPKDTEGEKKDTENIKFEPNENTDDNSEVNIYESLKLYEKYSDWGSFGEDGLTWVEISDYTGRQLAYIDTLGNIVIEVPSNIDIVTDFHKGLALLIDNTTSWGDGILYIIDTKGEIVGKCEKSAATERKFLNNGNIYFGYVSPFDKKLSAPPSPIDTELEILYGCDLGIEPETPNENIETFVSSKNYLFCKNTGKFVAMPWAEEISVLDYSDSLLLVHSEISLPCYTSGYRYFDFDGNCVLDLNTSNEYYKEIMYASDFENGEAVVVFVGLDRNWYEVIIDKTVKWITEPEKTSRDYVLRNYW